MLGTPTIAWRAGTLETAVMPATAKQRSLAKTGIPGTSTPIRKSAVSEVTATAGMTTKAETSIASKGGMPAAEIPGC